MSDRKILLGEGLENFRFFRCPEDVSFHFVYHTKAWSQWSWMSILSFKQFYLHTKIIAPRITFKCLMHLRHLQHRHVNSFVFSFQSFLSFVPIVYNLWLSSSALSIACKFIQTNLRKFHFRKLIWEDLNENWGSRLEWHLIHLGGLKFSGRTLWSDHKTT